MEYPTLRVKNKSRQMIDAFLGYNHNLRIGENEFYDMQNMTSDYYPVLSTRAKRGVFPVADQPNGLISKGELCRVENGSFIIGDKATVEMELSAGQKTMVSMGSYVIILPDKKWVNTVPKSEEEYEWYEWGRLEAEFENGGRATLTNCNANGYEYENVRNSEDAPDNPANGTIWMDTSSDPVTLKKYFSSSKSWGEIPCYIKIKASGIADDFEVGDGVYIKGFGVGGSNVVHTLYGCNKDEDYILVKGTYYNPDPEGDGTEPPGGTIKRKIPDMDFITECNNRLWGCKYGENGDGVFVNQIYASKLGDFKNWYCFDEISTDSYTASCGSDGPFTGAITHGGHPLFFKENGVHKVYGDFPSNFQVQYIPCRGVQEGCHNSLAIVGSTLYYKSRNAVCAYDGSMPVEISAALGDENYYDAVAGAHGNKYYINMKNVSDGSYWLFVYDAAKGMWHKEDRIRLYSFCSHLNCLYAIKNETNEVVVLCNAKEFDTDEQSVSWLAETGIWGMNTPDMKYISRLLIRMALEDGARVEVSVQYDSNDLWEQVCVISATSLRSFCIPVRPKRCDHFRIRISGEGGCKIYSITKTIEQGSDIS